MSAREITDALKGHWYSSYDMSYGMVCCPVHSDQNPSLKIADSDKTNDGIYVNCFAGCDWKEVKGELCALVWLREFEPNQSAPHRPRPRRKVVEPNQQKFVNIDHARKIWAASSPAAGTHVETYLRGRGITRAIPPTINFCPALKHGPTGLLFPAMIAAFSGAGEKLTGVQRTYLRLDGTGKATVSEPKMALGRSLGDTVRLGPAAEEIGICEGIETGLSAMQLYGGSEWCACGSHLDKIALPDIVRHIRIYADNGDTGQASAVKASHIYCRQGRAVTVISPSLEHDDFNNILISAMEAAA